MDIIIERGAGLEVHKVTVAVCVMGTGIRKEIRTFSTVTNDLLRLKEWLKENRIIHVAMESTGVYWKPIFNILEDAFEVMLVNARHVKHRLMGVRNIFMRSSDRWIDFMLERTKNYRFAPVMWHHRGRI